MEPSNCVVASCRAMAGAWTLRTFIDICSENQTKRTIPSESFEGNAINRSAIGVYKDNYNVTLDLDFMFEELGCNYT